MNLRTPLIALVALALLATPALSLHKPNGVGTLDTGPLTFSTPLGTPVWWDYSVTRGVPTGIQERTKTVEISNIAPVTLTAETFPRLTPDTPKACLPVRSPDAVVPTVVVHGTRCVKDNGYTVQIHYFPWTNDPNDPDHIASPSPSSPLATTVWRVDAVPLSYKEAILPPGHWQVWFDPAVSPMLPYDIEYRATSTQPFYFDDIGYRGCLFFFNVAGNTDESLVGCPNLYE